MRGRVLIGFPQIVSSSDDDPIADEQGGNRDLADQCGFSRKTEGFVHKLSIEVVVQRHDVVVEFCE